MIFYGHYRIHEGAFRPFITGYARSNRRLRLTVRQGSSSKWVKSSFLLDSGADETFLHYESIDILGIVAGVDIGLNNLAAVASNKPGFVPFLVNGRPLKSINQFYNKRRAQLVSQLIRENEE